MEMTQNWTVIIAMTATEKLQILEEHIRELSPVFRPAVVVSIDKLMYNRGWDDAMQAAQAQLLAVLEADDADLA